MKLSVFFLFISISAKAIVLENCGLYRFQGYIKKNKDTAGLSLIVHQGTKSEYRFKIGMDDELKLTAFIDRQVSLEALVDKVLNQQGNIKQIEKADYSLIELFNPEENSILLKKMECK